MRKKILSAFAMLMLLNSFVSRAQPYVFPEHSATTEQDFNTSICQSGGNFYTSGTSDDLSSGTLDINVSCRNSAGIILWNKTFDFGGRNDFSGKIRPTPYGVVITGTTGGLFDNYKQLFVLHLDFSGNVINEGLFAIPGIGKKRPNLYGFDVVFEPYPTAPDPNPNFVVVGMGVWPDGTNDEAEQRFGFIMKTNYNLSSVVWSKLYTTDPGRIGSWFDCMNNVERFVLPSGPQYHVTGSLSDYNSTWTQDQTVLNMMIDINGVVVWDNPFRQATSYSWGGRQYDRGTNSLLNTVTNDIFLLYHSSWGHGESIVKVNAFSGAIVKNMWFLPNQQTETTESNMIWTDNSQNYITMAGYIRNSISGNYNTFLLTGDENTFNLGYLWQKEYPYSINMTNIKNINYDYNLKPMDGPGHQHRFFAPSWLVRNDALPTPQYLMSSLWDVPASSRYFDNLLMQVDGTGTPSGSCVYTDSLWQGTDSMVFHVAPGMLSNVTVNVTDVPPTDPHVPRILHCNCGGSPGRPHTSCLDSGAIHVSYAYSDTPVGCYFNVSVSYILTPGSSFVGVVWRYPIAYATYATTFTATPSTILLDPNGLTSDLGATIVAVDSIGDTCYSPEYVHVVGCNGGSPIYKQGTTSIPSNIEQVALYPNPVSNFVRVDCPKDMLNSNYEIIDITGKSMGSGVLRYSGQNISTEGLPSGVYIMNIQKQGSSPQNYRFIKN